MSLEHSLALVTVGNGADIDILDVLGTVVSWGVLSTLFGLVALVFAIGIAALLDDRPLDQIFKLSTLELEKIGPRQRAAAS
jgi:hypothetical protein